MMELMCRSDGVMEHMGKERCSASAGSDGALVGNDGSMGQEYTCRER